MKLGEMLVRDGRLTDTQLENALKVQARDGGRIGTVLFQLGFIDLEALTVYLGLELGIPIATGAMLERAKRAAVRLLQPTQAFKHKVVPLVVQDRQLIAAIEDPHDFATLEALTQITGYRVLPRVAPEVRIYYYIERYYGVARPARFMKFGDTPRGTDSIADAGLPAPPLPGLAKTTVAKISLARVLGGLEAPTSGVVQYNGVDLRYLDPDAINQCRSVVIDSQLTLLEGTIEDNIVVGRAYVNYDDVAWALRFAELEEEVEALPRGIKSNIRELGEVLPSSKVVQILLARAVLGHPQVLVFDGLIHSMDPSCGKRSCADFVQKMKPGRSFSSQQIQT